MRSIDGIWSRGFTWALLLLSLPFAPMLLWSLYRPVSQASYSLLEDHLKERLGVDVAQIANEQVRLRNFYGYGTRSWNPVANAERQRMFRYPSIAALPESGAVLKQLDKETDERIDRLAASTASFPIDIDMANGWGNFWSGYVASAANAAFALRAAGRGQWDEVVHYVVRSWALSRHGSVNGAFLTVTRLMLPLLRQQPDTTATKELLNALEQEGGTEKAAVDPAWYYLCPLVEHRMYRHDNPGSWITDNMFSDSILGRAFCGVMLLSGRELPKALLESCISPGEIMTGPGTNLVLPLGRQFMFRGIARSITQDKFLSGEMSQLSSMTRGVDPTDAAIIYYGQALGLMNANWIDQRGIRSVIRTGRELVATSLAARVFRAENGRWPLAAAEMTPKYLPPIPPSAMTMPPEPQTVQDLYRMQPRIQGPPKCGMTTVTRENIITVLRGYGYDMDRKNTPADFEVTSFEADGKGKIHATIETTGDPGASNIACEALMVEVMKRAPSGAVTSAALMGMKRDAAGIWEPVNLEAAIRITQGEDKFNEQNPPGVSRPDGSATPTVLAPPSPYAGVKIVADVVLPEQVFAVWIAKSERTVYNAQLPARYKVLAGKASDPMWGNGDITFYPEGW